MQEIGSTDSFLLTQFELLYNTNKAVVFADVPRGDWVFQHDFRERAPHYYIGDVKPSETFGEKLAGIKHAVETRGRFEKEREDYMILQLKLIPEKISGLTQKYPSLKGKKDITVLVRLGVFHTGVSDTLRSRGVTRSFESGQRPYDFLAEGWRRGRFEKKIDDTFAARIFLQELLERMIGDHYPDLFKVLLKNFEKRAGLYRKIISQFGEEDIHEIYDYLQKPHENRFEKVFEKKLDEKNIRFPKTEEELDEFLESEKM